MRCLRQRFVAKANGFRAPPEAYAPLCITAIAKSFSGRSATGKAPRCERSARGILGERWQQHAVP
eukprot:5556338-Alexandrium_andersonii.AAC.1